MREMSITLTSFICQTRLKLEKDAFSPSQKRFANIETQVKGITILIKTDTWETQILQHNN